MTAACQTGLQALLTQAKQQLPTLARRLTALQLQDFLCTMHTMMQSVTPASVTRIPDVQVCLRMLPLHVASCAGVMWCLGPVCSLSLCHYL